MELSVKDLAAAIAEAQRPMFESLGKDIRDMSVAQKEARAESLNEIIEQAKGSKDAPADPNAARFLSMLTMSIPERIQLLEGEAKVAKEMGKGLRAARIARAFALAKKEYGGNPEKVPMLLADVYKDKALALAIEKTMTITDPTSGGFLTGEVYADDFIELLRPKTVLGVLGSRPYPMSAAKVHVPRLDAAASGYWVGEGPANKVATSKPKTGRTTLSEHTAAGLVPISNALLRDSSPAADAIVRDDLIKVLKLLVDYAGIYGSGSEYMPLGINNAGIQSWDTINGNFAARIDPDTVTMFTELLDSANVPMLNPGIFFNAKLKRDFRMLKSANGEYYYRRDMQEGKIEDFNWSFTTQIPTGSDGNGMTDLFMGDFSEHFTGERTNLGFSIDSSAEAAYYDGSSTQSAYQNLETLIRATYITDFLIRHLVSFVKSNTVWTKG